MNLFTTVVSSIIEYSNYRRSSKLISYDREYPVEILVGLESFYGRTKKSPESCSLSGEIPIGDLTYPLSV